jgi:hypothetical protein
VLLQAGANPHVVDRWGESPLDLAEGWGRVECERAVQVRACMND